MLPTIKTNTMATTKKHPRADCPLCGANLSLVNLRYVHVCGRRSGRPKLSNKDQVDLALKAAVSRMAQLSLETEQPQQGKRKAGTNKIPRHQTPPESEEQPVRPQDAPKREETSLCTEYNG